MQDYDNYFQNAANDEIPVSFKEPERGASMIFEMGSAKMNSLDDMANKVPSIFSVTHDATEPNDNTIDEVVGNGMKFECVSIHETRLTNS